MSETPQQVDLEFDGEILVPRINLEAYRNIYLIEAWVRKICITAWMSTYGANWVDEMDSNLRQQLEKLATAARRKLYLGAETHSDLIWQTTHGQLIQLISDRRIAPSIEFLTGSEQGFLQSKLDEIRGIRNILAHNRALSSRTSKILAGLLAALEEAVDTFRSRILYTNLDSGIITHEHVTGGRKPFQGYAVDHGEIIEYICLPVRPFEKFPDTRKLQIEFQDFLNSIIAFCLNKTGDEYTILTPKSLPEQITQDISDKFFQNLPVWTDQSYVEQDPRFACSPKIWFYENNSPLP